MKRLLLILLTVMIFLPVASGMLVTNLTNCVGTAIIKVQPQLALSYDMTDCKIVNSNIWECDCLKVNQLFVTSNSDNNFDFFIDYYISENHLIQNKVSTQKNNFMYKVEKKVFVNPFLIDDYFPLISMFLIVLIVIGAILFFVIKYLIKIWKSEDNNV